MNSVAGHLGKAFIFIAIGAAVSLAIVLPQRVSATHTTTISYVQRGLLGSVNCSNYRDDDEWDHLWIEESHPCWHNDEPEETFQAVDYTVPGLPGATAGASVYFYYIGDFQHFKFFEAPPTTTCHGVDARLYEDFVGDDSFRRGSVHYLHLDPAGGVEGSIASSFEWLGTIRSSEPPGCGYTGPHLHQSAESVQTPEYLPFYYNRWDNPDHEYYHGHTIYWPALQSDADSDSYTDNVEVRLSTDPQDACGDTTTPYDERGFDYYEPISPWPPDFDDSQIVNIIDLNVLLPPPLGSWGATSGDPLYYARRDLFPDGVINLIDLNKVLPPPLGAWGQTCT